jgi:hypothetical protein
LSFEEWKSVLTPDSPSKQASREVKALGMPIKPSAKLLEVLENQSGGGVRD